MEEQKIVPDVIDTAPSNVMEVKYVTESGTVVVNMGNELTPTQVKNQPTVNWPAEEESFYTLSLIDPDAPSREAPTYREWLHWLVVNIPKNDVSQGETLAQYIGAGPIKGTGFHRYVFLAFKQKDKINVSEEKKLPKNSGEGRTEFKIRSFAKKYNLGSPVSGNFFKSQYDDFVPKLFEQLSS